MLNTDGMFLSYIHINMPGGTQSRGGTPGIGAKFIGKERDNVSEAYVGYEDEFVAPCSSFIISLVLFFSLNWNRLQSYECESN